MKVAVLICGLPRSYKRNYQSYLNNVFEPLCPDVFISTWDWKLTRQEKPVVVGEKNSLTWYPEDGEAFDFVDLYKPKLFQIEDYTDETLEQVFQFSEFKKRVLPYCVNSQYGTKISSSVLPMMYKWAKCFDLFRNFCLTTGTKYDIVLRTRSDLQYFGSFGGVNWNSLDANSIFGKITETQHLSDFCVAGSYEAIEKYCDIFYHIEDLIKETKKIVPEHNIEHYLTKNKITWKPLPFNITTLR